VFDNELCLACVCGRPDSLVMLLSILKAEACWVVVAPCVTVAPDIGEEHLLRWC
jgi:hypothetical protein